jgi:SPP1 family predicted phage head-tail adaptor
LRRRTKNIGKFLHKVTFQDFTAASDGAGGLTQTWADTHIAYANIEPLRGNEGLEAEQLVGKKMFKFTTRYASEVASIDNQTRIKFGTRYFNVHTIINLNEENEFLEIMAWEV